MMELERFSVQDVVQLLTQSGIPPATVEWLEREPASPRTVQVNKPLLLTCIIVQRMKWTD